VDGATLQRVATSAAASDARRAQLEACARGGTSTSRPGHARVLPGRSRVMPVRPSSTTT
jgi:hypothetical protein